MWGWVECGGLVTHGRVGGCMGCVAGLVIARMDGMVSGGRVGVGWDGCGDGLSGWENEWISEWVSDVFEGGCKNGLDGRGVPTVHNLVCESFRNN